MTGYEKNGWESFYKDQSNLKKMIDALIDRGDTVSLKNKNEKIIVTAGPGEIIFSKHFINDLKVEISPGFQITDPLKSMLLQQLPMRPEIWPWEPLLRGLACPVRYYRLIALLDTVKAFFPAVKWQNE